MAKFCGGIRLDSDSFKIMKGVISIAEFPPTDVANAVTTCGQLWDDRIFNIIKVDGVPVITLRHPPVDDEDGTPTLIKTNCGVCLDGRFFKIVDGVVYPLTEETPQG